LESWEFLRRKKKIVDLEINGEPVEIQMKLDDTGAAFFVEEVLDGEEEETWSESLATSPIPEKQEFGWKENPEDAAAVSDKYISSSVQTESVDNTETKKGKNIKKKRRKKNQHSRTSSKTSLNEIVVHDLFTMDDVNDADHEDEIGGPETECKNITENLSYEFANAFDLTSSSGRKLKRTNSTISQGNDNSAETCLVGSRVPKPSSEAEALVLEALLTEPNIEDKRSKSVTAEFHYFSDSEVIQGSSQIVSRPDSPMLSDSEFENKKREEEQLNIWKWGELPISPIKDNSENKKSDIKNMEMLDKKAKKSWFGSWGKKDTAIKEEPAGVYLDEIFNDPEKMSLYLKPIDSVKSEEPEQNNSTHLPIVNLENDSKQDENESGNSSSLPMSLNSVSDVQYDSDCGPDLLSPMLSKHLPDLAASLCGGLTDKEITLEKFEEHLLTYSQLLEQVKNQKGVLTNPNLVIRVHEKYLAWNAAAPILLSIMLFKQPLPEEVLQEMTKDGLDVNTNMSAEQAKNNRDKAKKSWFGWFGSSKECNNIKEDPDRVEMACQTESEELRSFSEELENDNISSSSENDCEEPKKQKLFRKTLRLSSSSLSEMNLRPGSNEVEFSVTTAFQGTTWCKCHIYLWHHTDKVVISDIDGTITKSDVLGHILPVIGNDWAQSGVAQLFTKIKNNGYKIMYLSARAIGQASITKDYLQSVKQGDVCLPDGPIFLNPDSLYYAFRREVIDRNPEEFKIYCLKDIQTLFAEKKPFFAGYGNRPNDAFAYRAVGIPISRIFTINPAGELKHELTQTFQTSYIEQDGMVDQVFPSIGTSFDPEFKIQEFSSFSFWREPLEDFEIMPFDE